MLRYLTAGESHGRAIVAILEGMPAGLRIDLKAVNSELRRRQQGFGRGKRMQIENDTAELLSGVKNNLTLGSPLTLLVRNKDFSIEKLHKVLCPRPGHADLAGLLKYGFNDIREVLERASARGTVASVGIGALCKIFLREFNIAISSRVLSVAGDDSSVGMKAVISEAIKSKDTVGGIFEVRACGVPVGLGSYVQPDKRLDGRLAQAIISIPGIKALEFGLGFGYAVSFGSKVHDPIYKNKNKGFLRKSNNSGGIEGGISNGEDIILRACMKPICTLMNPLDSVNIKTKKASKAAVERTDTCVVSAAGVVAESACAYVLVDLFLDKFGSDSLADIKNNYKNYLKRIS
ncbi:MAG: chorismate synthase [Candidatus Omnitrophota bacterium]|jgi:chorismate synthase|nr:chorismate synthase [Candidatus Omnitrophota bacterium]MDD4981733.1 chorismate synthase [Candidatus Omnitrophota bacterium]MDD5664656.1 chorismate synthase [Candidatus Omnitrophota bacterium]